MTPKDTKSPKHLPLRETTTRKGLDQMKADLAKPQTSLDYTPGGIFEARVNSAEDAAKRARIALGEHRLDSAKERLEAGHAFAAKHGAARAQMNAASKAWSPKAEIKGRALASRDR